MNPAFDPFASLAQPGPDALLALIAMHRADPRADRIDVGVGVYRDAEGRTPVLRAVKSAEARLLAEQPSKAYLGAEGDPRFADLIASLIHGVDTRDLNRFGLQTPGGTGALRLGAELIARFAPDSRVWISDPTWPNHAPIFAESGLKTVAHAYFDSTTRGIAFDGMMGALVGARAGDILLLHGCCHNPTGTQFTLQEWRDLADLCVARGILPFIDLAYQGLGDHLDADVAGVRLMLDAVPSALIAYSCDKNFGLYRERVGALFVQASTSASLAAARDNLLALSRSLWSMPPDHGAAIVRIILDDPTLARDWRDELSEMRTRLNRMRASLASAHPLLAPIRLQRGMFCLLPIASSAVVSLRESHAIYMAGNGRINIAGLAPANLQHFAAAVVPYLSARGAVDRADAGQSA